MIIIRKVIIKKLLFFPFKTKLFLGFFPFIHLKRVKEFKQLRNIRKSGFEIDGVLR